MNLSYELGYDCLGPIFRFFLYRLRLIEQFKPHTPILFLSRGGLRIHYFYRQYLDANGLIDLAPKHDFYISRMAAFRALIGIKSEFAAVEVAKEYSYQTINDSMRYFLPEAVFDEWQRASAAPGAENDAVITAAYIQDMLAGTQPHAVVFQQHVTEQNVLLGNYFKLLTGDQQEVILVDTGWSGSIVKSLQDLFPETTFTAAFFGRYNYGKPPPPWFNSITGLVLQQEHFNPAQPQSCFVFHRHLIESLCEPEWPSVEAYAIEERQIVPTTGVMPESVKAPGEADVIGKAVSDFIVSESAVSPETVIMDYDLAIRRLARLVTYPGKKEAVTLGVRPRSVDFGRDKSVPVLILDRSTGSKLNRMKESLWLQGQSALEFGVLRYFAQFVITWNGTRRSANGRMRIAMQRLLRKAVRYMMR